MVTSDVSVLYEWAPGSRFQVDPEAAYETFERIREENDGELTADLVLQDAKLKRSPLHDAFEWDDAIAADQARKQTANRMILNVRVTTVDNGNDQVRAYVYTKLPQEDGTKHGFYTTPAIISENEQMYNETLERARGQLKAFRDRFEFLAELDHVFKAIDKLPE